MGIQCQNRSVSYSIKDWLCGKFYNYHSYFLIARSSISKSPLILKNSIGLIDQGYLGNIKAALYNTSSKSFHIKRGERYVQLVNSDLQSVKMQIVKEHRTTTRGTGGFGSTGA